jgi:hypothetical protein
MKVEFFRGKSGNWICPAQDDQLIVANGTLTKEEVKTALENGEGKQVGKNLLIGFGSETLAVDVKTIKGKASAEADKPAITWEGV